jgi:hypothetical protein
MANPWLPQVDPALLPWMFQGAFIMIRVGPKIRDTNKYVMFSIPYQGYTKNQALSYVIFSKRLVIL